MSPPGLSDWAPRYRAKKSPPRWRCADGRGYHAGTRPSKTIRLETSDLVNRGRGIERFKMGLNRSINPPAPV
jgi:hypothetical protein